MSAKASALNCLAQLLSSGAYSNLKLISQGEEFNVHKMIVCSQSPAIITALNGCFQEAKTNTINIDEFDAKTVYQMIRFMYGKDYDELETEAVSNTTQNARSSLQETTVPAHWIPVPTILADHGGVSRASASPQNTTETVLDYMKVNAIADYYDIPPLKELANTKIKKILEGEWSCITFPPIVNRVFASNNDPSLRQIVSSAAATDIEELISDSEFINVEAPSDFAMGILKEVIPVYVLREKGYKEKLGKPEDYRSLNKSRSYQLGRSVYRTRQRSILLETKIRSSRFRLR